MYRMKKQWLALGSVVQAGHTLASCVLLRNQDQGIGLHPVPASAQLVWRHLMRWADDLEDLHQRPELKARCPNFDLVVFQFLAC